MLGTPMLPQTYGKLEEATNVSIPAARRGNGDSDPAIHVSIRDSARSSTRSRSNLELSPQTPNGPNRTAAAPSSSNTLSTRSSTTTPNRASNDGSSSPSECLSKRKRSRSLGSKLSRRSTITHPDLNLAREILWWLYPCLLYLCVMFACACMGNYLSYLVKRDLNDQVYFRVPLQDYILPQFKEGEPINEGLISVADGLAFAMYLTPCVWAFYERDRHIFARVLGMDAFLTVGKTIARTVTILPESLGPTYCDIATQEMRADTTWDYIKWIIHPNYEYCSDMMWSGHCQHYIGGAIALCAIGQRHKALYRCLRSIVAQVVLVALAWGCAVAGTTLLAITRAHYSVDLFVAMVVTGLAYTNPHLHWLFEKAFNAPDQVKLFGSSKQDAKHFRFCSAWREPISQRG